VAEAILVAEQRVRKNAGWKKASFYFRHMSMPKKLGAVKAQEVMCVAEKGGTRPGGNANRRRPQLREHRLARLLKNYSGALS